MATAPLGARATPVQSATSSVDRALLSEGKGRGSNSLVVVSARDPSLYLERDERNFRPARAARIGNSDEPR